MFYIRYNGLKFNYRSQSANLLVDIWPLPPPSPLTLFPPLLTPQLPSRILPSLPFPSPPPPIPTFFPPQFLVVRLLKKSFILCVSFLRQQINTNYVYISGQNSYIKWRKKNNYNFQISWKICRIRVINIPSPSSSPWGAGIFQMRFHIKFRKFHYVKLVRPFIQVMYF